MSGAGDSAEEAAHGADVCAVPTALPVLITLWCVRVNRPVQPNHNICRMPPRRLTRAESAAPPRHPWINQSSTSLLQTFASFFAAAGHRGACHIEQQGCSEGPVRVALTVQVLEQSDSVAQLSKARLPGFCVAPAPDMGCGSGGVAVRPQSRRRSGRCATRRARHLMQQNISHILG